MNYTETKMLARGFGKVILLLAVAVLAVFAFIMLTSGGPKPDVPLSPDAADALTQARDQIVPPLAGPWWGAGDPSVVDGDGSGGLYESFTDIVPSSTGNGPILTSIALLRSLDGGTTWSRIATLAPGIETGASGYSDMQEISTLVRDPSAPQQERVKLLWLHYMQKDGRPDWTHGWVAMKTAPSFEAAWSPEVKLVAGKGYDPSDRLHPEPRQPLFELPDEMRDCIVLQEPGALAASDGFYLTLGCVSTDRPAKNRLVLLKFTHQAQGGMALAYRGAFLDAADAKKFKNAYQKEFPELASMTELGGAPDLFTVGTTTYLLTSPMNDTGNYMGCALFKVTDLATASVERDQGGVPHMLKYVQGKTGIHRGACTYSSQSTATGIQMFELTITPTAKPPMHPVIIDTGVQVP